MPIPLKLPASLSSDPLTSAMQTIQRRDVDTSKQLEQSRQDQSKPFDEVSSQAFAQDKEVSKRYGEAGKDYESASNDASKYAEDHAPKPVDMAGFKPEPIDNQQMQAMGAIMTAFALIGSRHTGNSMTAAGNALAGAIEGYRAGNHAKFETDYKTYKTNFDNAVKTHESEIEQYREILHAKDMGLSAKARRLEIIAQGHGDTKAAMDFASHNLERINKAIDSKLKMSEKTKDADIKSLEWARNANEKALEFKEREKDRHAQLQIARENLQERFSQDKFKDELLIKKAQDSGVKLSVAEEKATSNYATMSRSDPEIDRLVKQGVLLPAYTNVTQDDNGYVSVYGEYGRQISLTDDQQELLVRSKQFAEGAGHLKSGSRINKQTMDIMRELYLPVASDSEHTKQVKSEQRKTDINAAKVSGGRGIAEFEKLQGLGHSPSKDKGPSKSDPMGIR